eukprot:s931_g7.t1
MMRKRREANDEELVTGTSRLKRSKAAFHIFDVNGDGFICKDDLATLLKSGHEQEGFAGISVEEIGEIMKEVDQNGDGHMSFEEFMALMADRKEAPKELVQQGVGPEGLESLAGDVVANSIYSSPFLGGLPDIRCDCNFYLPPPLAGYSFFWGEHQESGYSSTISVLQHFHFFWQHRFNHDFWICSIKVAMLGHLASPWSFPWLLRYAGTLLSRRIPGTSLPSLREGLPGPQRVRGRRVLHGRRTF